MMEAGVGAVSSLSYPYIPILSTHPCEWWPQGWAGSFSAEQQRFMFDQFFVSYLGNRGPLRCRKAASGRLCRDDQMRHG